MKKVIVCILVGYSILAGCQSTLKFDGVLIAYYQKESSSNIPGIKHAYCLDSIRLQTNNEVYPILGDLVQNEHFLYELKEPIPIGEYSKVIRLNGLYCTNPLENHIHEGGEIYDLQGRPNILAISFNISGTAKRVIPKINSIKSDSLEKRLEESYTNFFDREGYYYCKYSINESEYLIITEILSSTELRKDQIESFGFTRSTVNEFWRHGLW